VRSRFSGSHRIVILRAVELDPGNLRARYALVEESERQGGPESEAEARKQIEAILQQQPRNLKAQIERARLAAKRGDGAARRRVIEQLAERSASWPVIARDSLRALQTAGAGSIHARPPCASTEAFQYALRPGKQGVRRLHVSCPSTFNTSSTHVIAAIMLGKPMVVRERRTTCRTSSGVAPASSARRVCE